MTDFELAKSQAKINYRPIMLAFSGSDWCPWCVKLEKEVFDTPLFRDWAKKNVIFRMVDFPRHKVLPPETVSQNEHLAQAYHVDSFPTVVLIDGTGSEIARTGYQTGGAESYIASLDSLLRK